MYRILYSNTRYEYRTKRNITHTMLGDETFFTNTRKATLQPLWDQGFKFEVDAEERKGLNLEVGVYDDDDDTDKYPTMGMVRKTTNTHTHTTHTLIHNIFFRNFINTCPKHTHTHTFASAPLLSLSPLRS